MDRQVNLTQSATVLFFLSKVYSCVSVIEKCKCGGLALLRVHARHRVRYDLCVA